MKPSKKYFDGLIKKIQNPPKEELLFLGDSLQNDIKGANDNNIDVCWCNYNNIINNEYNINYEIHKLEELKKIL